MTAAADEPSDTRQMLSQFYDSVVKRKTDHSIDMAVRLDIARQALAKEVIPNCGSWLLEFLGYQLSRVQTSRSDPRLWSFALDFLKSKEGIERHAGLTAKLPWPAILAKTVQEQRTNSKKDSLDCIIRCIEELLCLFKERAMPVFTKPGALDAFVHIFDTVIQWKERDRLHGLFLEGCREGLQGLPSKARLGLFCEKLLPFYFHFLALHEGSCPLVVDIVARTMREVVFDDALASDYEILLRPAQQHLAQSILSGRQAAGGESIGQFFHAVTPHAKVFLTRLEAMLTTCGSTDDWQGMLHLGRLLEISALSSTPRGSELPVRLFFFFAYIVGRQFDEPSRQLCAWQSLASLLSVLKSNSLYYHGCPLSPELLADLQALFERIMESSMTGLLTFPSTWLPSIEKVWLAVYGLNHTLVNEKYLKRIYGTVLFDGRLRHSDLAGYAFPGRFAQANLEIHALAHQLGSYLAFVYPGPLPPSVPSWLCAGSSLHGELKRRLAAALPSQVAELGMYLARTILSLLASSLSPPQTRKRKSKSGTASAAVNDEHDAKNTGLPPTVIFEWMRSLLGLLEPLVGRQERSELEADSLREFFEVNFWAGYKKDIKRALQDQTDRSAPPPEPLLELQYELMKWFASYRSLHCTKLGQQIVFSSADTLDLGMLASVLPFDDLIWRAAQSF